MSLVGATSLSLCGDGSFQIIKKINNKAYQLDLLMSSNFCPHLIFKFGDLIEFSVLKD